jgi:hypothetical protein
MGAFVTTSLFVYRSTSEAMEAVATWSHFGCAKTNLDEKASKEIFCVSGHLREFLLIAANHEE